MKVFAVGDMSGFDVEDLDGRPAIVIVGSKDEVCSCALMLGKDVRVERVEARTADSESADHE